jgi:hypothetical protein
VEISQYRWLGQYGAYAACSVALCRLANWNGSTLLYGPGANGTMLTIDIVAAAAVLIITALLVGSSEIVNNAAWIWRVHGRVCISAACKSHCSTWFGSCA